MIVLWAFVIVGLVEPKDLFGEANEWKTWVSQNFTWLYIAAFVRPQPANPKFPSTVNPNPPARRVRFFRAATAVRPGATPHPRRAEGRIPPPARPSPNRPVRVVGSRSPGGPNRRLLTGHSERGSSPEARDSPSARGETTVFLLVRGCHCAPPVPAASSDDDATDPFLRRSIAEHLGFIPRLRRRLQVRQHPHGSQRLEARVQ